tara:strand:- start:443 stop:580 length:138 start_codon:yes stop_codon:yes gene_type:complete
MVCKKCEYESIDEYFDDDGNKFVPSHYCADNKHYSATDNQYYIGD